MRRFGQSIRAEYSVRCGAVSLSVIAALLIVGLLTIGGWLVLRGGDSAEDEPLMVVAKTAPFDHVVTEHGEVESSDNVEVVCEVKAHNSATGTAIIDVIAEGTPVKKGDWLVTLDSSALENELQRQKIAVNAARAKMIAAKSLLEQAQIGKTEYLEGTFVQEEQLIESEILVAEEKLSRARETAAFSQRLAALGFQTAQQLKADLFAVEQAQVELDLAQGRLRTLREISKNKMLVGFDSDIEASEAQSEADQSSYDEELKLRKDIEDQIEKCQVTAPQAGLVVYANIISRRGGAEFVVEPGAMVRERQVIIRLPDPSKMQVKATINESAIVLVAKDEDTDLDREMPVDILVGAFEEGRVLKGRVRKVNKYAEPSSWFSSQIKEYAAFIEIFDPPEDIRTGMTAEVRIYVERLDEALQIPVQAIYEHKGRMLCIVKEGDSWQTQELTIGATNDKTVTVLSGVRVNDRVVLNPRQHLDKLTLPQGLLEPEITVPPVAGGQEKPLQPVATP